MARMPRNFRLGVRGKPIPRAIPSNMVRQVRFSSPGSGPPQPVVTFRILGANGVFITSAGTDDNPTYINHRNTL